MGNLTQEKFGASQSLTSQANKEVVVLKNFIREMSEYRIIEFLRMDLPQFSGSNMEEDTNEFMDEVYKTLAIMGLNSLYEA